MKYYSEMTEQEKQILKEEITFVNNQTPTRVRNHRVRFYTDKSISSIEPIGAGFGIGGFEKGTVFTIDEALAHL